jgi:hypothetical protein
MRVKLGYTVHMKMFSNIGLRRRSLYLVLGLLLTQTCLPIPHAHANIVWPAVYVTKSLTMFWVVVVASVLVETAVFLWWMRVSLKRALLVTIVCNAVSFVIGTPLAMFGMIGWHLAVDPLLGGTFNPVNWTATFLLMACISALLELMAASLIFSYRWKHVFVPLLLGNVLSYLFICWYLLTNGTVGLV